MLADFAGVHSAVPAIVARYKVRDLCIMHAHHCWSLATRYATCAHASAKQHLADSLCLPTTSLRCNHLTHACLVSLVYLAVAHVKHDKVSAPAPYATPGMACLGAVHTAGTVKYACFAKVYANLLVVDNHFCQACSMHAALCALKHVSRVQVPSHMLFTSTHTAAS